MIDRKKVKAFWDARASAYGSLDFDSIANLEQDEDNLALKVALETGKVASYLGSVAGKTILDLGAGVGQWTFRFVEGGAARVVAVEYSQALADVGRREAARRGLTGVDFVVSSAEDFVTDEPLDVVFISGLFVYLNDDAAEKVLSNVSGMCRPDTIVLLRDGTGVQGRHEIDDRPSEHLRTRYSALYRTADEYEALFARHGLSLLRHESMFEEGCHLNKFPETRLRIYRFALAAS